MTDTETGSKWPGKILVIAFASLVTWGVSALLDTALRFRNIHVDILPVVTTIAGWSCLPLLLVAILLRVTVQNQPTRTGSENDISKANQEAESADKSLERTHDR